MNKLDLEKFIQNMTDKTNKSEIEWHRVPFMYAGSIVDRLSLENIRESFYSDGKTGRVVIGKYLTKIYYEDDEFIEEHFFLTLTDTKFKNPITFSESDDEIPDSFNFSFPLALSKLHRLIQINTNDVKNRLDNFF